MKTLRILSFIVIASMMSNSSLASMACDLSISNYILKHKNINKTNKERLENNLPYYLELEDCLHRVTPLGASVIVGNESLLKYLAGLGANVNVHAGKHLSKEHNKNALSPLIVSIKNKNNNIFNYLVSLGADENTGSRNMHPIFFAVAYNNAYVVNYYLNENVNPNLNHNENSLLSLARKKKHLTIVNTLLKYGAK